MPKLEKPFLPQPNEILSLMEERYSSKKVFDELGFTGEYSLSIKNLVDIIIELQKDNDENR